MKKNFMVLSTLAFVLAFGVIFTGCEPVTGNPPSAMNTGEKNFWAMNLKNNTWYSLTAKKLAEGAHCIVYADVTAGITVPQGEAIAAKYDNYIYTPITGAFGDIKDVDENGRVIFLMLDIIDGYKGTGGYVAGYFQPTHMFAKTTYANSNEADMLYMDTNPGFDSGNANVMQSFYSTMAHELQHLIEFSETVSKGKAEKDLWINEGLSTAAEYIYGTGTGSPAQQTSRIAYFNNDPQNTIAYGNNFFVWNGWWEDPANGGDVLADYSTAYLFFQWLRIHASNGVGIYKEIITSTNPDYRAVTQTAKNRIAALGLSGTDATDWEKILLAWFAANYMKESSPSLYGYKGEITPTTHPFSGASTISLYPGEGVYSAISSSISPSGGGNIKYAGISGTVSTTGPYTTGTLLTFNANPNKAGSGENGAIASNVVGGPQASVQMSLNGNAAPAPSASLPTSYPIDVHFRPDGTLSPDSPRVGISRPVLKGVPINKN